MIEGKGNGSAGGIVGLVCGGGKIIDCQVIDCEIHGSGNVGGIAGTNDGGVIEGCIVMQTKQIGDFIGDLKKSLPILERELSQESTATIKAGISAVECQLSSPNPEPKLLVGALKSIKNILENIAGNVVAELLLKALPILL